MDMVNILKSRSIKDFIQYAQKRPDNYLIKEQNEDFLEVSEFLGDQYAMLIASQIAMKCYASLDKETLDFYYAELRKYAGI